MPENTDIFPGTAKVDLGRALKRFFSSLRCLFEDKSVVIKVSSSKMQFKKRIWQRVLTSQIRTKKSTSNVINFKFENSDFETTTSKEF
jgi:hypothetical protein